MNLLDDCRRRIDKIDTEITSLFLQRMEIVQEVAKYKLSHDMVVLQPEREEQLLTKLTKDLPAKEAEMIRQLYSVILYLSRESQTKLTVESNQ